MEDKLNKAFASFGIDVAPKQDSLGKAVLGLSERHILGHKVTVMEDRLSKAKLFYNINDVIADFHVEKTGKEIKEKLETLKALDEAEAQACVLRANEALKSCTIKPISTDGIGDYELRGMKLKFGTIPTTYTWDEVYACDKECEAQSKPVITNLTVGAEAKQEKVVNPYRVYNQNIRMYVESRVEALILDTVIKNIDEKKKYKLSAEQAAKLGF